MTDTNHDGEAAGSSADVDSSREESGDSEPKSDRLESWAPHQDRRTPASEASREGATHRVGAGTRRRFLAAVSAASAATLAGCPGSSDSGQTTSPAPDGDSGTATAESGETATDTPTPEPGIGVRLPAPSLAELQLGVVSFEEITLSDEGGS